MIYDRYREHLNSMIGLAADIDTIGQLSRGAAIRNNTCRSRRQRGSSLPQSPRWKGVLHATHNKNTKKNHKQLKI